MLVRIGESHHGTRKKALKEDSDRGRMMHGISGITLNIQPWKAI